jgi:hypothetical protein
MASISSSATDRLVACSSAILNVVAGFILSLGLSNQFGLATPVLALKEASNCQGCHNPGRTQRPVLWRRCTLDCAGCHADPNGGAARNEWGYYYSQDQLAMVNLLKPTDPLKRDELIFLHYDGRYIEREAGDTTRSFPMAHETSLRLRMPTPMFDLNLSFSKLLMGRIGAPPDRAPDGKRMEQDKAAATIDALPMNLYLRAARGQPVYGLRRPNHTLWIRERIGLDQFATTDSISIGGSPNVPFFHVSQMLGDSDAPAEERQKGASYHAGVRGVSYGWHINASGWKTSSEKASIEMTAAGLGANFFGLILYGERNWRQVHELEAANQSLSRPTIGVQPSSTISEFSAYLGLIPGIMPGYIREAMKVDGGFSERVSYVVDLHPVPFLQLELWRRQESGRRHLNDLLAVAHLYADF